MFSIFLFFYVKHQSFPPFSQLFPTFFPPLKCQPGAEVPNGSAQKGPRNEHRLQGITREAQGDAQSEGRQLSQGEDQEVPRVAWKILEDIYIYIDIYVYI